MHYQYVQPGWPDQADVYQRTGRDIDRIDDARVGDGWTEWIAQPGTYELRPRR
jgi:hypothetical protein